MHFSILSFLLVTTTFLASLILCFGALNASSFIHNNLLTKMMKAPMEFFEKTSKAKVVAHFTNDIGSLDEELPDAIDSFVETSVEVSEI